MVRNTSLGAILILTITTQKAQSTSKIGIRSFMTIKMAMVNGLNTVTKLRTHNGSNELRLAAFPDANIAVTTNTY